jgi:hypothetical protein
MKRMIVNFSADLPSFCAEAPGKTSARSSSAFALLLLAIWIGALLPSPSAEGAVAQPIGTPANRANQVNRVPSISATPERVTVNIEPGRTEIRWDTGDGSKGFVYVSANGGKRTLFATGAIGSTTAPWIQSGSYVFELYRDVEQRTLLATVTVSGISETRAPPRTFKHAPSITATPDRVKVDIEPGRSDIRWDTGDGSKGFVYVSTNDGKRTLFATGPTGSITVPWIKPDSYVFELYRDVERQTLLATVTVSGISEPSVSPLVALRQGRARWLLYAVLLVVVYLAVYFSSTGAMRSGFPAEPTTSPRQLHVARNLLLGVAVFACLDGAIFHTGLYTSVLAPDSFAGRMAMLTRAEKQRVQSGLKEVLVVGDSRMAEGFSVAAADELGSTAGFKFLSLAEPASSIDIWHYMLREVDPAARRYSAIVIPYGYGYERSRGQLLKIAMAAPILRYNDCFAFSSSFQQWSDRFRAFAACIFRGSAFQTDVVDLLEHPIVRAKNIQLGQKRLLYKAAYKGRDADIVGTSFDPKTGEVTFPPRLTEAQREAIRYSLVPPSQSERQHVLELQHQWTQRILERYAGSPTAIVVMPTPRGPFGGLSGFSMAYHTFFGGITTNRTILSLPEHMFDFLEAPEYYFDGYHVNVKGRQRFTEATVAELVRQLKPTNSAHFASDPE